MDNRIDWWINWTGFPVGGIAALLMLFIYMHHLARGDGITVYGLFAVIFFGFAVYFLRRIVHSDE